jgi:hypothetical protein
MSLLSQVLGVSTLAARSWCGCWCLLAGRGPF